MPLRKVRRCESPDSSPDMNTRVSSRFQAPYDALLRREILGGRIGAGGCRPSVFIAGWGYPGLNENQPHQGVLGQVRDFIIMNFLFGDDSNVPAHTDSLLESGVVDSTGVLELVDFLETDMGTVVADAETLPANLDSIENLTQFVMRKRRATLELADG